mmetsp:Transcript_90158/g.209761  ORF Transcript_90158/g.209761 Transcript_90158/m.209761 type:complete len:111 (-) Transcript_90158:198-530(-)
MRTGLSECERQAAKGMGRMGEGSKGGRHRPLMTTHRGMHRAALHAECQKVQGLRAEAHRGVHDTKSIKLRRHLAATAQGSGTAAPPPATTRADPMPVQCPQPQLPPRPLE